MDVTSLIAHFTSATADFGLGASTFRSLDPPSGRCSTRSLKADARLSLSSRPYMDFTVESPARLASCGLSGELIRGENASELDDLIH